MRFPFPLGRLRPLTFMVLLFLATPAAYSIDWNQFKDPDDGQLDISNWLLERGGGFLPIPLLITEPADDDMAGLPPSVSFGAGAYTGNDSWLAGGGHFGSWKLDRIRYMGAAGLASINLKLYILDSALKYNIDGAFLLQDLQFRVKETPIFLGVRYSLFGIDATFENPPSPPLQDLGLDQNSADGRDAGLGLVFHYDSRDNLFSPERGQEGWLIYTFYDEVVGGEFNYRKVEAKLFSYHPLGEKFILGLRLDGARVNEGAPFYALPFIDLRGVPIGRYQDQDVGVAEIEGLWNLVGRWSLVGFGGVGRTEGDLPLLSEGETIWAGGVGFRYLMARRLNLKTGIDLAWSTEDFAFYLRFGTGWR